MFTWLRQSTIPVRHPERLEGKLASMHVNMGRWVNLLLFSFFDECNTQDPPLDPDTRSTSSLGLPPDPKYRTCFNMAVSTTRDRLVAETGNLMVVTALLATISIQLAIQSVTDFNEVIKRLEEYAKENPDEPIWEHQLYNPILAAIVILSAIAFVCSIAQLSLGALIGVFSYGRSPRTFLRFLLWGEFLAESSISCFLTSLLTLLAAALLYTWTQVEQIAWFKTSEAGNLFISILCGVCFPPLALVIFLALLQWSWDQKGRVCQYQLLRCLQPFLGFRYEYVGGRVESIPDPQAVAECPLEIYAYRRMSKTKTEQHPLAKVLARTMLLCVGPVSLLKGVPGLISFYLAGRKAAQGVSGAASPGKPAQPGVSHTTSNAYEARKLSGISEGTVGSDASP